MDEGPCGPDLQSTIVDPERVRMPRLCGRGEYVGPCCGRLSRWPRGRGDGDEGPGFEGAGRDEAPGTTSLRTRCRGRGAGRRGAGDGKRGGLGRDLNGDEDAGDEMPRGRLSAMRFQDGSSETRKESPGDEKLPGNGRRPHAGPAVIPVFLGYRGTRVVVSNSDEDADTTRGKYCETGRHGGCVRWSRDGRLAAYTRFPG